jgi:hypothetical protein
MDTLTLTIVVLSTLAFLAVVLWKGIWLIRMIREAPDPETGAGHGPLDTAVADPGLQSESEEKGRGA